MSTPYLSFGEYLTHFMEQRGLTGVAMARILQEKSATLIVRMKADQCTPARCEAFLEQLNAHFDLTEEDRVRFRRGLVINQLGREGYLAYRAIHMLFTSEMQPQAFAGNLRELLTPPHDAECCDVICMQCSSPIVTGELTILCANTKIPLSIRHYVTFPLQSTTAQFALSLLPILFDPRYVLTELNFPDETPKLGISAQNFIFIRTVRSGKTDYTLLLPCENGNAINLSMADEQSYQNCIQFIASLPCKQISLNPQYAMQNAADVSAFLNTLREHEHGNSICIFKRDFCFSFLPVDVLQRAFNDMLTRLPSEYSDHIIELRRLCFMRHRAVCETTHPIHMLVSPSGILNFLRTGILSDHFFGLRAFFPQERQVILQHIISLVESNPLISVYIAREESVFGIHDLFVYEKHGVLLMPSRTDYRDTQTEAQAGHIETLFPDPVLTQQVMAYFTQYLLPQWAYSREESLQYMRSLLAE